MLLPTKARYAPGDPVVLELATPPTDAGPWTVTVSRLGDEVARVDVPAGATEVPVGPRPADGEPVAQTAVEVLADPVARMRYGFVASFAPGRDVTPVLRLFRRLHLTAGQFYDWAHRHADLVGPTGEWSDPLGQPVS